MKVISLIFSFVLFAFCGQVLSDNLNEHAHSLFLEGNSYYNQGDSEQAISSYEKILNMGLESGPLYYNLGNAYLKKGVLGKAILNYLRAQRLMPQDNDLKSNLAYARTLIKSNSAVSMKKWPQRIFTAAVNSFSLDGIALLCGSLYFLLSVLIISAIIKRRKIMFYFNTMAFLVMLIFASFFWGQLFKTIIHKEGIITAKTADSKFEPFDEATTFFTLNEGEDVSIIVAAGEWIKIKRDDGKQGWIKKSDIAFL